MQDIPPGRMSSWLYLHRHLPSRPPTPAPPTSSTMAVHSPKPSSGEGE